MSTLLRSGSTLTSTQCSTVKPYEGAGEFAIEDLTDDEWNRFVAALSE
jgi:hypothetical protein